MVNFLISMLYWLWSLIYVMRKYQNYVTLWLRIGLLYYVTHEQVYAVMYAWFKYMGTICHIHEPAWYFYSGHGL